VRIADFGLSRIVAAEKHKFINMNSAHAAGTPLYMAPEILPGALINPDEKCDVYSYGILSWELFTHQTPYKEAQAKDSKFVLFDHVKSGGRPDVKAINGKSLREFLDKCWHADPKSRYSFKDLDVSEDTVPWSNIIADAMSEDSKLTSEFWRECLNKSQSGGEVKWSDFCHFFERKFAANNIDKRDPEHKALKLILEVDEEGAATVKHDKWQKVVEWFGPFERTAGKKLTELLVLLQQPWFHGAMTAEQADMKLCVHPPGTFLVRFSASAKCWFTISWVEREKDKTNSIRHYQVAKKAEVVLNNVRKFISSRIGKKANPCPNRPSQFEDLGPPKKKS